MSLPLKKDAMQASPLSGPASTAGDPPKSPVKARLASSGAGRKLIAIAVILGFLLVSFAWLFLPPSPGKGGGPGAEKGWNVYLDLKGDRTYSGRDIEIYGDIIVEKGAALRFVDCNLTVNGTFFVFGNLTFQGCRIGPYPAVPYYRYYGKDPEPLTLSFDLSNRSRASLRFDTRHYLPDGESVSVNVFSGGGWHNGVQVLKGAPHKTTNHTLDLTRFCGGPVKIEFAPTQQPNGTRDFQLFGLEVDTDRGALSLGAVDYEVPKASWYLTNAVTSYSIRPYSGSVLLSGSEVRQAGYVVSGRNSTIAVRTTTVQGSAATSSGNFGYGYFAQAENCSLEISDCDVLAMGIVQANNSLVSIENTRASFGSTIVLARNTELRIRESAFDNCSLAVYSLVDRDLGRGSLEITDSVLLDCNSGIVIANQTGTVRGCEIGAVLPFGLMPPRSMSRANCTAPAVLALNDSRIQVNTTGYGNWRTGILACSAIPIKEVYEWFRSNSWNATSLYTRTAAVAYQDRNENRWQWGSVYLDVRGTAEVLGPGFEPLGTSERQVDPIGLYQDFPYWDDWGWHNPLDRQALDLETIVSAGSVYYHNRTDEGRLNFSISTPDGMAFLEKDLGALSSPMDILRLDFVLQPVCDISITSVSVSKDRGSERLAVYASYSIDGLRHDYEAVVSVLLGGRQLVYDTEGFNTYYLDALQVKDGGDLTVKVIPLGVEDLNLSDNVATVRVRVFDNPCELSGPQEMDGLWVLKPGVDLALKGCTLNASGRDAAIVGMGRNRLSVERSTLAYDALYLNVSQAHIADSDLIPRGGARLRATTGELVMDNVTLNSRRQEYAAKVEAARKELAADPALLTGTTHWYSADWQYLRPALSVESSSCIVNNSRFVDIQYFNLVADGNCSLAGSSLVLGDSANLNAPDIRLERNLWEAISDMSMTGLNLSLLDNSFLDIQNGLIIYDDVVNFTAVSNSFSRAVFNDSRSAALNLHGAERLELRENTFSGCQNGIYLFCDADPVGIFQNNSFQGVGNASVARWKRLTYEIYPSFLGVDFQSQPYVRYTIIAWADLFGSRAENRSGWTSYGGGERHVGATMEFADSLVDGAGVARSLDRLELRITVSYSDGRQRVFERTVEIPADYQWTERLE